MRRNFSGRLFNHESLIRALLHQVINNTHIANIKQTLRQVAGPFIKRLLNPIDKNYLGKILSEIKTH